MDTFFYTFFAPKPCFPACFFFQGTELAVLHTSSEEEISEDSGHDGIEHVGGNFADGPRARRQRRAALRAQRTKRLRMAGKLWTSNMYLLDCMKASNFSELVQTLKSWCIRVSMCKDYVIATILRCGESHLRNDTPGINLGTCSFSKAPVTNNTIFTEGRPRLHPKLHWWPLRNGQRSARKPWNDSTLHQHNGLLHGRGPWCLGVILTWPGLVIASQECILLIWNRYRMVQAHPLYFYR